MEIYHIVIGLILLALGRKLFWLFVGIVGFLVGMEITGVFIGGQAEWIRLAIAIGMGCLGALLAILVQRVAFTVGGFVGGVFLAFNAGHFFVPDAGTIFLVIIIGAGVIGAVVATLIMDEAITILTCLVGASLIVGELNLGHLLNFAFFVVLVGAGFLIQEKLLPPAQEDRHPL